MKGRVEMGNKMGTEVFIRDVLQGVSGFEFIVCFADGDGPFIELEVTLWGNELLDELVFPVCREPFTFDLKHEVSKGQGDEAVGVRFNPGLHELGFKGINDAADLVIGGDLLVSKELFTRVVESAKIGNSDRSG